MSKGVVFDLGAGFPRAAVQPKELVSMRWSILLCGLPQRMDQGARMPVFHKLCELSAGFRDVEVQLLYDNQRMSTGAKRNRLVNCARGEYISFVDDDDDVTDQYVRLIHRALRDHPGVDLVCFNLVGPRLLTNNELRYRYHPRWRQQQTEERFPGVQWKRPQHTSVWQRALVRNALFSDMSRMEELQWQLETEMMVNTYVYLDEDLYRYQMPGLD